MSLDNTQNTINTGDEDLIERIGKIGQSWSPALSPDGEQVAFLSDLSGTAQVWIVSTRGGWPNQITAVNDTLLKVSWSPDGQWLALLVVPQGGLTTQVYVVHPDGTQMHCITQNAGENNWMGPWSRDGRKLAFSSTQDDPNSVSVFCITFAGNHVHRISASQGAAILTDWSPDQSHGLLFKMVNRSENDIELVNFLTGVQHCLTPHIGPCGFHGACFGPNNTVYLTTDQGREKAGLGRVELTESMSPSALELVYERQDAELETFTLSPDGLCAALVWNANGRSEIELLNLTTLKTTTVPNLRPEIVHNIKFSSDGLMLVIQASGASAPLDIWLYNLESAGDAPGDAPQLRQVTFSSHPGIDLKTLIVPEPVFFSGTDRLTLHAWYYRPNRTHARYPTVISFHGGPEAQERPEFNSFYQSILKMGIAILAPNVRGSTGYGRTFANLDNGALRLNAVQDIKTCVDYLNNSGLALAGKIGLMGESYGGFMVLSGLTEFPQLFACGVTISGIANFETFFANTEPWMAAISKIKYGDPEKEPELIRKISPIHRLQSVVAPTLVIHGALDTNVPVSEAEQVVNDLKKKSIPVKYILLEDEGHVFEKKTNKSYILKAIMDWFDQYLVNRD